jgi:hypothetical protein
VRLRDEERGENRAAGASLRVAQLERREERGESCYSDERRRTLGKERRQIG